MRIHATLIMSLVTICSACNNSDDSGSPTTPLADRYELSSTDSVPEGVAFDAEERAFYAGSLQGGSIVRIDSNGEESIFRPADSRAQLVGIKVDSRQRLLWACAQRVDGMDNRVWVFDLESKELKLEFLLGALTTNGACNDLVLDSSGAAYVTDPAQPYIYRLDPTTGIGSIFATDPLLDDFTGAGLGMNGIALTADESALIIGIFATSKLLRVSMPDGARVEPIALSGDTLLAPDGLVQLNGDVYVVSSDSVSRVRPNADFSTGEVVEVVQKNGLSTATVAESQLYVIRSEVLDFVLKLPLVLPFEILRVDTEAFNQ